MVLLFAARRLFDAVAWTLTLVRLALYQADEHCLQMPCKPVFFLFDLLNLPESDSPHLQVTIAFLLHL